jgi:monoamine oxidase
MTVTRRDLLGAVGLAAGSAAMYHAMATLGHAQESTYQGRITLEGEPNGRRVLVLGAGLAGMTAALELREAGYDVQVLEYREKAGGRCWTLRGDDRYTDIAGLTQTVQFEDGGYLNPGPWRIPYNHHAVLDYCKRLGVKLEPFIQKNHNAYLHRSDAFDGKPQRFRHIATDYRGHVSELLAKATDQGMLDAEVTQQDKEKLLDSLRAYGILNDECQARAGIPHAPSKPLGNLKVPTSIDLRYRLAVRIRCRGSTNRGRSRQHGRGCAPPACGKSRAYAF